MSRVNLTADLIRKFACPPDKAQAFIRDSGAPGLGVRATPGKKAYIFQSRLIDGRTARITIGDCKVWGIDDARREARRLQIMIDQGIDPRADRKSKAETVSAELEHTRKKQVPALEVWGDYIEARRHHWQELHLRAHLEATKEGGEPKVRGRPGVTAPGILRPILMLPLADIDAFAVRHWLKNEAAQRPTRARQAFAMLRAFLNWCADHPDWLDLIHADACASKSVRQELPKKKARQDALRREQLHAWFGAVRAVRNPGTAAYFQILLLTGARPGELARLRWENVDFQWCGLTISDKVEGERTIPMTPYVAALLRDLHARNAATVTSLHQASPVRAGAPSPWVFGSDRSASGRIATPILTHQRACASVGIECLTLHGLRRSFGSLAEWTETPAGVVAQIMGHKPSATAEKHYRVRPLDLLRMWHTKIEGWILEQAGIQQPTGIAAPGLQTVA